MRSYLAAFVVAAVVAAVLTPLVKVLAVKTGAISETGGRNVHQQPIPRLGGVALCLAVLVPIIGLLFVESGVAKSFQANVSVVVGFTVGGIAMCLVGVADDLKGVRAPIKLAMQVLVAGLAFACGFRIHAVSLPLIGELSMGVFALPVTVIWIVGIINAVNLIDGLDGLAAGVAFFAGVTNFVVAYIGGGVISALVMAAMLGALVGFLLYNFNPARIFMGDSGSYLLGFILATTPLVGPSQKTSSAVALLVPIVALGVPIFDTMFTIVRRFLERRPLFSPDRGHVHHRLLDLGITHRRTVLLLYGVSIVFTVAAIAIHLGRSWQIGAALLVASVVAIGLARFAGYFSMVNLRKRQQSRMRTSDVEFLRHVLPSLVVRLGEVPTEQALFAELEGLAKSARLASLVVSRGPEEVFSCVDEALAKRRAVAHMRYPIGNDALARAHMTVGVTNDFEATEISPQAEILLQIVADLVATHATRLGSAIAPDSSTAPDSSAAVEPDASDADPDCSVPLAVRAR